MHKLISCLVLSLNVLLVLGQSDSSFLQNPEARNLGFDDSNRGSSRFRVSFWNVENLFDTRDDSLTRDEAFTPYGDNHWTYKKLNEKWNNISKTIIAVGGWEAPEIIGFCEVENRWVLEQLLKNTVLDKVNYQIVHEDSPDNRGIDVALLYRPDKFEKEGHHPIRIHFEDSRPTRDILHVWGKLVHNQARLHVFVNHWPSRYGGHLATNPKRMKAAQTLRAVVDSIQKVEPYANIVIMGDLNDHPNDESVLKGLAALPDTIKMDTFDLYNMMYPKVGKEGTHKYQGVWGVLDQIIVSHSLMKGYNGLKTHQGQAYIFKAPFLLEPDETHRGYKLNRTFIGMKYHGGFSDHLPIYVDLQLLEH